MQVYTAMLYFGLEKDASCCSCAAQDRAVQHLTAMVADVNSAWSDLRFIVSLIIFLLVLQQY